LPQELGCGSSMRCWRRLRDWLARDGDFNWQSLRRLDDELNAPSFFRWRSLVRPSVPGLPIEDNHLLERRALCVGGSNGRRHYQPVLGNGIRTVADDGAILLPDGLERELPRVFQRCLGIDEQEAVG